MMRFEPKLLEKFRQYFIQDLDQSPDDFSNTYRFLDWERNSAYQTRDLGYQAQIYTLFGMLEYYRRNQAHSLKYFQLANDIFKRIDDVSGTNFTSYKMSKLSSFAGV